VERQTSGITRIFVLAESFSGFITLDLLTYYT